jgi:hypothetical protein
MLDVSKDKPSEAIQDTAQEHEADGIACLGSVGLKIEIVSGQEFCFLAR